MESLHQPFSLVADAYQYTPVGCVLADVESDTERHDTFAAKSCKLTAPSLPNASPVAAQREGVANAREIPQGAIRKRIAD